MTTMVETIGTSGRSAHLTHAEAQASGGKSVAKNIALFFAAPFIGLAYILAFPLVGVYAVVKAVARNAA